MNKLTVWIFILTLFVPFSAQAQMFTVGSTEERPDTRLKLYTAFTASWEIGDFEFVGEELPAEDRADFQNSLVRFRFENPGLTISAGFGGALTGMDDRSYVNLNALLYNDFAIVRNQRLILGIPIQVSTDLKSVSLQNSDNTFRQSSFVFGTGASIQYRIHQRVGMSLRGTPNIGFSFPQGGLSDGGRLFSVTSNARFYFDDVIGSNALVLGYDFDYRDYNIEDNINDYKFLSHSISIGIAF